MKSGRGANHESRNGLSFSRNMNFYERFALSDISSSLPSFSHESNFKQFKRGGKDLRGETIYVEIMARMVSV